MGAINYTTHLGSQSLHRLNDLERNLDLWVETQPYLAHAKAAKRRILECLEGNLARLDLRGLDITSLPEGFNPPYLKKLDLSNTSITHLPEGFNPPQLEYFNLLATQITRLPEAFNPPRLIQLYLNNTRLTHLPEGFNPPCLLELNLDGTRLTYLPEGFNPPELKRVDLIGAPITRLPEGFNPPELEKLNLEHTGLTHLPEGLFNLPSSCEISITLTNFSSRVQENLRARVEAEGYQGPHFVFNMGHGNNDEHLELPEILTKVFEKSQLESPQDFEERLIQNQTKENKTHLKIWLNRLFETASAKASQKTFFKEVVGILEKAVNNENFKNNVFYRILDEASETCGDRVALSVLHLGIQKDLEALDISHPKEVADFLVNGMMTLDLLEDYARDLVPTLPLVDPLEVYLGLPVYFKEEFNIPINTGEMLYFTYSGLRQEHLDAAREKLQAALAEEEKVLSFLIEQPKWLECLKKARPKKMLELEETRDRHLEEGPFEKTAEILDEYRQGLKDVSKVVRRIERFSLRIRP